MARARTAAGVLLLAAVLAAVWLLFLRDPGGEVAKPRARTEPEVPAPTLLEGRAPAAGAPADGSSRATGATDSNSAERADATNEAGTIEGTVTGWDGKPAGALTIVLVPPEPPDRPRSGWHPGPAPLAETKTDADGRYVLSGLPPAKSGVVVVRVSETYEFRGPDLRWKPTRQRCDLDVPTPATLEVRLAASSGEHPRLRQVTVITEFLELALYRDEEASIPWGLEVQDDGRAARLWLGPGPVKVQAWLDSAPMVEGATTLLSGATTHLVLQVPADGVVRGRVIDVKGRPAPHGDVSWTGDRSVSGDLREDGTFRLAGVGRGRGRLEVNVSLEGAIGQVEASADGILPDGPDVELVVRPPPRVSFHVKGLPEGKPLTVALISRTRSSMARFLPEDLSSIAVHPSPGEATLMVLLAESTTPVMVDLAPMAEGDTRDLGTLRFVPGLEAIGRVTTADGVGVPGLELVHVVEERLSFGQTTSDEAGRFTLSPLPARPFLLRVRGGGFPQHLVPVDPSSIAEVVVVVTPGGFADVRVVDEQGSVVPNAAVTILPVGASPYDADNDQTRFDTTVGPEGRDKFRMCAGPRRLKAQGKDGSASAIVDVTIREGETTEVTLTLREKPAK